MAKYIETKNGNFNLIANNGKNFGTHISKNVKKKIGPLDDFVNATKKGDKSFNYYLDKRAKKLKEPLIRYSWYSKIAKFLIKNSQSFLINFQYLHLVNSEPGYQYIKKENIDWPKTPIYYMHIYTRTPYYTKYIHNENENTFNRNVYALKYKPNFHYRKYITDEATEDKYNKDKKKQFYKCKAYDHFYSKIKQELKGILSTNHKIAVMDIPSSKAHTETVLDQVIHEISGFNSNIINASDLLIRTKTKETGHKGKGVSNRSILDNIKTLNLSMSSISKEALNDAEAFVILDDVTTTGSSFIAADTIIRKNQGRNGKLPNIPIINLAYAKTVGNFYYENDQSNFIKTNVPVKGIVFDIDNTLINTNKLVKQYHKYVMEKGFSLKGFSKILRNVINKDDKTEHLINIISNLVNDGIEVSYVSNRGYTDLDEMMNCMIGHIDNNRCAHHQMLSTNKMKLNKQHFFQSSPLVISSTTRTDDKNPYSAKPKPGSYSIIQAVKQMRLNSKYRIIGIGNQESDMIAYKRAGVEPILVNWFNNPLINIYNIMNNKKEQYKYPVPLIDYNRGRVQSFNTVNHFDDWLKSQISVNSSNNTHSGDLPF